MMAAREAVDEAKKKLAVEERARRIVKKEEDPPSKSPLEIARAFRARKVMVATKKRLVSRKALETHVINAVLLVSAAVVTAATVIAAVTFARDGIVLCGSASSTLPRTSLDTGNLLPRAGPRAEAAQRRLKEHEARRKKATSRQMERHRLRKEKEEILRHARKTFRTASYEFWGELQSHMAELLAEASASPPWKPSTSSQLPTASSSSPSTPASSGSGKVEVYFRNLATGQGRTHQVRWNVDHSGASLIVSRAGSD
jgi:hypothetical protein